MGGSGHSNLWWCVWIGGLREGFMEETVPAVRIIEAEKLRQVPIEAHTCYKCQHIKKI